MNTDWLLQESRLSYGDITHRIIGSAMEVMNDLGHGLSEKCYENALVHELKLRGLSVEQQKRFEVAFKSIVVGTYIPDLIVNTLVIVETKCVDRITDHDLGQMLNYLRITKLAIGLIINFKHARLDWQRVAL